MPSLNRPARLNRSLLTIAGVLLLAAGAFALATYFGRLRLLDPASALTRGTARPPTWVLWVTAAAAVIVGLLVLRWMLAQLARKPKTHTWRFEQDPEQGRTELAAGTAIDPFLAEVETYDGVHAAHARLAGNRSNPTLALVLNAEQDGDLAAIRQRLDEHGLPRLREALDLSELPTTVEFRFTTKATAARIQ